MVGVAQTFLQDISPEFPECPPADHLPNPAGPTKGVSAYLPPNCVKLGEGSLCRADRLSPVREGALGKSA